MIDCAHRAARGGWNEDRLRQRTLATRCRVPFGFWNTWSNLAYALVGIALAVRYQDSASAWMAMALCALAVGSAAYHAFKTIDTNRLDWIGMYAVFGALVAHGWLPNASIAVPAMAAGSGLLVAAFAARWRNADWHMAAAFVIASLPVAMAGEWRALGLVVLLFGVGYACWIGDRRGWLGRYGHAGWHLFTSVAIGALYVAQRGG